MEVKLTLEERLSTTHPELLQRFEEIALLVENTKGDIVTADEAECQAIKEVRLLGGEIMHSWARHQRDRVNSDFENKEENVWRNGKKKFIGKQPLEK
jgi:hypothetical protein